MVSSFKQKTFTIQSETKNVEKLRKEVSALLDQAGFDEKTRESILVALGEGVTNCIRHSYHCATDKTVDVTFEEDSHKITLRIRDYGDKVDLARIKAKETPQLPPVDPGGLGIYFMKTIMDEMTYNTEHSNGNELILIKNKKGAPGENPIEEK